MNSRAAKLLLSTAAVKKPQPTPVLSEEDQSALTCLTDGNGRKLADKVYRMVSEEDHSLYPAFVQDLDALIQSYRTRSSKPTAGEGQEKPEGKDGAEAAPVKEDEEDDVSGISEAAALDVKQLVQAAGERFQTIVASRASRYSWYTYTGAKGRNFTFAGKKYKLNPNDVFGVGTKRNGLSPLYIPSANSSMHILLPCARVERMVSKRSAPFKGIPAGIQRPGAISRATTGDHHLV
jgi:hypothetical protein